MDLTVVIPTIGRDTLVDAVESCVDADEILVVQDLARTDGVSSLPAGVRLLEVYGGDHGYTARALGMRFATGTHLAFLDDDDIYTDDAIELMRDAACDRPVIFRMDHYLHGILWREPLLAFGNVSTQMFLVPNVPDKLGTWAPHMPGLPEPGGDYVFIRGCCERMGEPVWRREVVSVLRPFVKPGRVSVETNLERVKMN